MLSKRLAAVLVAVLLGAETTARGVDGEGFENTFDVRSDAMASVGRNKYFILEPGYQLTYMGKKSGKDTALVVTVLDETNVVDGVQTRVVEERETAGGELVRLSKISYAIDKGSHDVYCFGADVEKYVSGKIARHESLLSGVDGVHYGLVMPGTAGVGRKYYEMTAPTIAMRRGEIAGVLESETIGATTFKNCVKVLETLQRDGSYLNRKVYAPEVGLIVDGEMRLAKSGMKDGTGKGDKVATVEPAIPEKIARAALDDVGADAEAEEVWAMAINDPTLSSHDRQNLIEDLNENGFADPNHVTRDDLPLILSRLELIEEMAPAAMDEVNAAAFAEAYKDLLEMAAKAAQQ